MFYVAYGFGDGATFGLSKAIRQSTGMDRADYDSNEYFGGQVASVLVPSPTAIARQGSMAWKLYNKFDDSGKCASMLTRMVHGGCFVAGTKVLVSELPYAIERHSVLWSDTEWLDIPSYIFSSSSSIGEKNTGYQRLSLSSSSLTTRASSLSIPIEDVPLGARIPTKNPRPWEYDDSLPDPDQATWAKLSITMFRTDGGIVDAELIRPRSWIESVGIEAGKLLPLNIEELQVRGSALVTSIDDCPEIADGQGSVVTARFCTREVHTIARVEILGPDGEMEVLEGTTIHPIWSKDRQDWVPLGELDQGETLLAADGSVVVASLTILNQPVPVYNIEVHGEHVYQVGKLGVLVHNAPLDCVEIGRIGELAAGTAGRKFGIRSILNPNRWRFPDKIDHAAKTIYETKNVAYQHLSTQLRDYVKVADDLGYKLVLNMRANTQVSASLQRLFDLGRIIPNRTL